MMITKPSSFKDINHIYNLIFIKTRLKIVIAINKIINKLLMKNFWLIILITL